MNVFVAGATGVIGRNLVPLLVKKGYRVGGMTRSPGKADVLASFGAEPIVCDVFDASALTGSVAAFGPDVVVHELTDLPDDPARIPELAAATSRIRREGTRNLLRAAEKTGTTRFLAQSVAWELPDDGASAKAYLETAVLGYGGVVLRYGQLYGPGTYFEHERPPPPRIHVYDAARRTVALLSAPSGIVTLTDGE